VAPPASPPLYRCFISYAYQDEPFPQRLYDDLKRAGVPVWKFNEDAVLGRPVWGNIDRAISAHDKVIVVCSETSLQRPAILREIDRAILKEDRLHLDRQKDPTIDEDVLFPVMLDDYLLQTWQHPRKADVVSKTAADFRRGKPGSASYRREVGRLLKALDPRAFPQSS
jgi:hypothetical protein